jgi:hypothetical protein
LRVLPCRKVRSEIYRKYLSTTKAVVDGKKWRVDFNVSLRDGSIERWTGEGGQEVGS